MYCFGFLVLWKEKIRRRRSARWLRREASEGVVLMMSPPPPPSPPSPPPAPPFSSVAVEVGSFVSPDMFFFFDSNKILSTSGLVDPPIFSSRSTGTGTYHSVSLEMKSQGQKKK